MYLPRDAYVAVMRLVESVDDTVTCQKTILAELLKPLEVTRTSECGCCCCAVAALLLRCFCAVAVGRTRACHRGGSTKEQSNQELMCPVKMPQCIDFRVYQGS